jgi:hypothetical protein
MADRPSRPHHSPRRTPTRTERRIIKVRVLRRWGPARIGYLLGLHPSTVHRVLTRYRLARLSWLDRPTGQAVRRIESTRCGDLVHVDVKKLGKIPAGGGWRMLGHAVGKHNKQADKGTGIISKYRNPLRGYHYLHTASTGTPGWLTPSCWLMSARTPPQRLGHAPTPGSLLTGSPCIKC